MIDKESTFISLFNSPRIGDDGAVIAEEIYSKDLFCEGIHFKREWMSLEQIAAKSMLVNISDAIAMNATPKYLLLGIKIPKSFDHLELQALACGFQEIADAFDIEIIGGDTIAGDRLDISITLISHSKAPLFRTGLQEGDIVGFTGQLGEVKKDLDALFLGQEISATSRFIRPILRIDFMREAAPYLVAGMDISDGLSKDLSRLSQLNQKGFAFFRNFSKDTLCSGEEYELLFVCKEKDCAKIEQIAKNTSTPITFFATVVAGSYESVCKEHHFE